MRSPYPYPPNWTGGSPVGSSTTGSPNNFPVAAGVQKTTPAYIYNEYLFDGYPPAPGDADIQYFVAAYNDVAQSYIDWFCGISLPVYPLQTGEMLDWVAAGIYGFDERPLIPIGTAYTIGPYNTFVYNAAQMPYDGFRVVEPSSFYQTSDDLFQRIMTWHLYLGDGKQFDVKWLKRRVMRFLVGTNGTGGFPIPSGIVMALDSFGDPVYWPTWYNIDQTYAVSVQFAGADATISILPGISSLTVGPYNTFRYNAARVAYNGDIGSFTPTPQYAFAPLFGACVAAGVIELPGPYSWAVQVQGTIYRAPQQFM